MADYIPGGDAEFNAWLDNFVTCADANPAKLRLVQGHTNRDRHRPGHVERDVDRDHLGVKPARGCRLSSDESHGIEPAHRQV